MGKMSIQALYRILHKNNAGKYPQAEHIIMSDCIECKLAQAEMLTLHNDPVIGGGKSWSLTAKAKKLLPSKPPAWWVKEEERREQIQTGFERCPEAAEAV